MTTPLTPPATSDAPPPGYTTGVAAAPRTDEPMVMPERRGQALRVASVTAPAVPGVPTVAPQRPAGGGPVVNLLLVAHGTREPAGAAVIEQVAERVRALLGVRVQACYVDVRRPTPADALATLPGPVVAVPMFLAAGYHVHVDTPAQITATGRTDVRIAETLGPDPALVAAAADRLREAGYRPGDAVVFAVIGSSDARARADGALAARCLGGLLDAPVTPGTVATRGPRVPEVVGRLRAEGAARIAIASWLLAPGLFHRKLHECGADVVAAPLATHEAVAELVVARYAAALTAARPA